MFGAEGGIVRVRNFGREEGRRYCGIPLEGITDGEVFQGKQSIFSKDVFTCHHKMGA